MQLTVRLPRYTMSAQTYVGLNGQDITGYVRELRIEASVRSLSSVYLELIGVEVNAEVDDAELVGQLALPFDTREGGH